ncbi:MAG: hypothetical protein K2X11_02460 [Acetobacteraceae bacterium]|nr:hypothetical protein [Acetobacteraceae bacterium]
MIGWPRDAPAPDTRRPALIIGNGPSAAAADPAWLADDPVIFRINYFFLEETRPFGRRVDVACAGTIDAKLALLLRQAIRRGDYAVGLVADDLAGLDGALGIGSGLRRLFQDAPVPRLPFAVTQRPPHGELPQPRQPGLEAFWPRTGLRAIHLALRLGFRRIRIVGMDFLGHTPAATALRYPPWLARFFPPEVRAAGFHRDAHATAYERAVLGALLGHHPNTELRVMRPGPGLDPGPAKPAAEIAAQRALVASLQPLGCVETVAGDVIRGWAADPRHPHARLRILALSGDRLVAEAAADQPRWDTAQLGLGSGAAGFALHLPPGRDPERLALCALPEGAPATAAFPLPQAAAFAAVHPGWSLGGFPADASA